MSIVLHPARGKYVYSAFEKMLMAAADMTKKINIIYESMSNWRNQDKISKKEKKQVLASCKSD